LGGDCDLSILDQFIPSGQSNGYTILPAITAGMQHLLQATASKSCDRLQLARGNAFRCQVRSCPLSCSSAACRDDFVAEVAQAMVNPIPFIQASVIGCTINRIVMNASLADKISASEHLGDGG
jgi:hypothetical protein